MGRFPEALNEQVAREYAASQQYVAIAVYYDAETLPRLAAHFYRQAVEERNHAMMIVQYLLDADERVAIPGVDAPRTEFADAVAPVRLALEQERAVTEQIARLTQLAREEQDLVGEQFLHWFLQEQREEVASMS
jgi:bacterioferritin B